MDLTARQALITKAAKRLGMNRNLLLSATVESLEQALETGSREGLVNKHGEPLLHGGDESPKGTGDLASMIAAAIDPFLSAKLDADGVQAMIDAALENFEGGSTMRHEFNLPEGEKRVIDGLVHPAFPELVKRATRRQNSLLLGPAGSGKSYAAEQAAKLLDLPFYPVSCGKQTSKTDIFGFMHAGGSYVAGPLYTAMKFGGVMCWDEFDRINDAVGVMANNPLANGVCLFPNGEVVRKHADCIFVVTMNSLHGATAEYTTATKQDVSTLTRFAKIDWSYAPEFELALFGTCEKTTAWVKYCQSVRSTADRLGLRSFKVTPRTMEYGAFDLKCGDSFAEIEKAWMFCGVPDADVQRVRQNVAVPSELR